MIICKWQQTDNLQVSQLEKECFSDCWSLEMIVSAYNNPNFLGYVAKAEDLVIGYIAVNRCLDEAEINLIAVSENHRRKNVATMLIDTMIKELKTLSVEKIFLEVRRSNKGAQALYEKLGFTYIGVRSKYYQGVEDALLMCKVIKE